MEEKFTMMDLFALQKDGTKQYLTQDRKGHTTDIDAAGYFSKEEAENIVGECLMVNYLHQYMPISMLSPEEFKKKLGIED